MKFSKNNIFEKYVTFRIATLKDKSKIICFYKSFWDIEHILVKNESFFDYEFLHNGNLNFILAEDKKDNKLLSVVGFYSYGLSKNQNHICASMSRVHPDCKIPFLGVETLRRLKLITNAKSYCGTNTNPLTMLPLCKSYLKHKTGEMNHYYLINENKNKFKLCSIKKDVKKFNKTTISNDYQIKKINFDENLDNIFNSIKQSKIQPFKSRNYFIRRYLKHPIYEYILFGLFFKNKLVSLFILRTQFFKDASVLRFIDYFGNLEEFKYLGEPLQNYINLSNYEYLDIITNMPSSKLLGSKFKDKSLTGDLIPNYFEPFLKENIKIHYETDSPEMIFFRGDADGDRPRRIKTY